jgi:hypothetical protein
MELVKNEQNRVARNALFVGAMHRRRKHATTRRKVQGVEVGDKGSIFAFLDRNREE